MEHPPIDYSAQRSSRRYELLAMYPGLGNFWWLLLLIYVAFIVLGNLPMKVVFTVLLVANAASLLLARQRDQFVEVGPSCIRVHLGYGPSFEIAYGQITHVGGASDKIGFFGTLLSRLVQVRMPGFKPFAGNTEISLARKRWLLVLTPCPFVWPSGKLRLPIQDGGEFAADVSNRVAVAGPGTGPRDVQERP
jgi:hypothetical protein